MNEEKQGAERAAEAVAIARQQREDLEHLKKNTHPSLHNVISLGPGSDGTNQEIGDYAALTLRAQIVALQEDVAMFYKEMRQEFDELRSQVLKDWTPETPEKELPQLPFISELEEPTQEKSGLQLVPSPEEIESQKQVEEAKRQVEEADAEHLRLNTKELPQ